MLAPRKRKNESNYNFSKRALLYRNSNLLSRTMDQENYKKELDNLKVEYMEIVLDKENGKQVKLVIPACQFNIMTKAEINKLLNLGG